MTLPTIKQKTREEFRTRLIELDDCNMHMNNIHEPIKGDIYFDGIEMEAWLDTLISSVRESTLEEVRNKVPTETPYSSSYCQNRNGLYYCGTCEQVWEDCSCPARNTGFNACRFNLLSALAALKNKV